MLKLNDELKDKISYILIGGILLTVLIPLIADVENAWIISGRTILTGTLAAFYLLTAEKKDLFYITFALFVVQAVVQVALPPSTALYYISLLAVPFVLAAAAFGVLAYQHSKEFKAFEMLEYLLALFLLISASKYIVVTEYTLYFAFGVSFLIATLIYNNNMWMRYKDSEKDLLIFLLVISFVDVIQVSAKHISF